MFCHKCGKQIEDESKFCSYCGAMVPDRIKGNEPENELESIDVKAEDKRQHKENPKFEETENKTKLKLKHNKKMLIGICLLIFFGTFCAAYMIPLQKSREKLLNIVEKVPEQYADGYIMGDYTEEYNQLLQESKTALDENRNNKMKALVKQWSVFEDELTQYNENILMEKQKEIEAMDASLAYDDEKQQIEEYKLQIQKYNQAKNYIAAQTTAQQWQNLLTEINNSGQPLEINIEQIDSSEYPKIRFYLEVTDLNGATPQNLSENIFQFQELGTGNTNTTQQVLKAVQIDQNSNLNINLLADVSGSMQGYPILQAKNAMQEFLNYIQFSIGDMVELTIFSDNVSVYQPFTSQKNILSQQITQLPLGSMTSLYDALYAAVLRTATQSGAKCVVAFTDGMDNISHCMPEDVIEVAKRYRIPIYIVGIGSELDGAILQDIAYETNGFYKQIYDVTGISEFYNQIYRKQKQLYLVECTLNDTDKIEEHSVNIGIQSRDWKGETKLTFAPNVLMSVDDNQVDFLDGVDKATNLYLHGFVNAINTNDFSYLEDIVVPDSPLAKIQEKYIQRDIEEKLQSYEIINKEMQDENTCIVTVKEIYDINNIKQPLHMLVQQGNYILKKQSDGTWKFYDFAGNIEVLQKLNY